MEATASVFHHSSVASSLEVRLELMGWIISNYGSSTMVFPGDLLTDIASSISGDRGEQFINIIITNKSNIYQIKNIDRSKGRTGCSFGMRGSEFSESSHGG